MNFENQTFTGTAKDFVECGVKINGRAVDQLTVNAFGKHNLLEVAGFGDKPARGRTPTLYRAVPRDGFTVAFNHNPVPKAPVLSSKALAAVVQSVTQAADTQAQESLTVAELVGAVEAEPEVETQISTDTGEAQATTEVETQDGPF